MPDTPKHFVSVAGIVVNDAGQVLVIRRRDNGQWEPPGGVLELDEFFEQGVRREIKEETGIPVEVEQLTGVCTRTCSAVLSRLSSAADPSPIEPIPATKPRRSCGSTPKQFRT